MNVFIQHELMSRYALVNFLYLENVNMLQSADITILLLGNVVEKL